jgi:hypothetical protein
MKLFFSTSLLLLLTFVCQAQSFEVVESNKVFKGIVGEQIKAQIAIKNLTDRPVQVVIKRLEKVIGTSQTTFICWDGDCLSSIQDQLPVSKKISSQETSLKFESILEAGLVPGISAVKYLIYNRDNPADAIEYEVNYTIEEKNQSKALFVSPQLRLNDVYPNPVTSYAIIDYNILNEDVKAKIVLHNVLGSIVGEYDLAPFEKKLKIKTDDFNPGVYFYTLYMDGDGVMTHKLIIRK